MVDAEGNPVTTSSHNITFTVSSGPGRIVGTNNGDPQCHVENHATTRPAYHGLVRAVVMGTVNAAGPGWIRDRIREIDLETGLRTTVLGAEPPADPAPIVVSATADGLAAGSVTVPTSTDPGTDGVLAVAAQMAGKPVFVD